MQLHASILNFKTLISVCLFVQSCSGLLEEKTIEDSASQTEIVHFFKYNKSDTSSLLVQTRNLALPAVSLGTNMDKDQSCTTIDCKGIKRKRPKGNESPESEEKSAESIGFIKPQVHFKHEKEEYRRSKKLTSKRTSILLDSKGLTYTANFLKPDKKDIFNLPPEILEHICSYLTFKDIIKLKNTNRAFYTYITGYSKPGLIGVLHKPDLKYILKTPTIDYNLNFKLFSAQAIPSFFFYQFVRGAFNCYQEFWPYLEGTNIQTVSFLNSNTYFTKSTDRVQILDFLDYLKKTDINTINLQNSGIEDVMLEEIAEKLKSTSVHNISLAQNKITVPSIINFIKKLEDTKIGSINLNHLNLRCENAAKCVQTLQGSKIHTICLSANRIKTSGLVSIAKYLNKTNIQTLDLSQNFTKDEGAIAFCQNLQNNKLRILDLSKNDISAKGAAACIENMQHTSVCKLILANNNINGLDLGLIAKKIQGTSIEIIDLSHNRIRVREILKFADNLKNTNIRTVNISNNSLYKNDCSFIRNKYPNITWII
jgi:hypothetical protein